ncbi:hypothetical protein FGG08_005402 [Glutinoglossum americanum]|uniref:Patatin-like phospholipase domain-containing protein n=1 Tax=Glutinoglossum americanum TaxID=1670608 RepID=A0A9P8I3M4_9PEZI|nr:hypothetical protein FGG08_005402 [Glutinoglossum americanum]
MSILQSASVLHGSQHQNGRAQSGVRRKKAMTVEDEALRRRESAAGNGERSILSPLSPVIRLILNPASAIASVVEGLRDQSGAEERAEKLRNESRRRILYAKLKNATTYGDWRFAAEELDIIEGNIVWKADVDSPDYNAALVEARLKQLDDARVSCNVEKMLFLVRTSLTRGLGDMGNIRLYKHSHIGTKDLIERYINSALDTLQALMSYSPGQLPPNLDSRHILNQVLSARQAFGRSALLLSGGATFGMCHVGVIKSLWENNLLPRIISGASAGSIVSSILCTTIDKEIPAILESFPYGDLAVFEKEGDEETILQRLARFLKIGAWIDISHLTGVMKGLLGDMTFQEAYNRTRRVLNICVSSASLYELPRLLNYVTAPNVLIWSAVAASCSVPLVFSAASLLAKNPKTGKAVPWNPSPQRWIDGSVDNDLPMTRLAEMFNVNHFIVSQVNPHVVPFVARDDKAVVPEEEVDAPAGPGWVETLTDLAKGETLHRMHVLAELGIFPTTLTKARSVLSQKYSGDITIFPELSYADLPRVLKNPTTDFMLRAVLRGERAAWPKLARIRNHCAIELALDLAVQQLRARVVFSPSQADLRMNAFFGLGGEVPGVPATPRPAAPLKRRWVAVQSSPEDSDEDPAEDTPPSPPSPPQNLRRPPGTLAMTTAADDPPGTEPPPVAAVVDISGTRGLVLRRRRMSRSRSEGRLRRGEL